MDEKKDIISDIRKFNLFYTNYFGYLNQHLLETKYSVTDIRVLIEIDRIPECTANKMVKILKFDRSYMSRILKRFEKNGLIERKISETDKRVHYVSLTEEGKKELAEINYRADKQVAGVIQYLNDEEKERLRNAAKELMDLFSRNEELKHYHYKSR
ncbi:MarR family transcriptional regulator [Clostridium sp. MSJ-8]|uniref:MarR family winged helix-turn-helix transcriptional regulator n=1 Tax=Clostridium sp. MSJ-8 TaxID=2841510 RepID=UPI001C0EEE0F|nr:MarR family transcriptional regulator [Clostridium sp. MSJ-8]MBU5488502.1 MarR family transcriptional regulator [Clostridium sp. MSJ-8]